MGLSRLYDISRSGLRTYQNAMTLTSQNIANSDNENYSRQKVSVSSAKPEYNGKISFGNGVKIGDVQRIQDTLTQSSLQKFTQSTSFFDKQTQYLTNIESVLNEPSEYGLSNFINQFFDSWEQLSVNPLSQELRANVVNSAQKMSSKMKSVYDGISDVKNTIVKDANQLVSVLNKQLEQLNTVNKQIKQTSLSGISNNDLLDERDRLLSEISDSVNVNISIDENNVANISVGGVFAAGASVANQFIIERSGEKIYLKTADGSSSVALTGGKLHAATNTYNKMIPNFINDLDTVASAIMTSVNSIHQQGYTIHQPPQSNIPLFDNYSQGTLTINSQVLNDSNYLAVSMDGSNGNNEIALQIAALKDAKLINGSSIMEKYSDFTNNIGSQKQFSEQNYESDNLVLQKLKEQKASVSGVSIDEEIANILKYQRAYDASAKLTRVADEMLRTLLNIFE